MNTEAQQRKLNFNMKKTLTTTAKFKSRKGKEIIYWHQQLYFRNCTGNPTNPFHLILRIALYVRFHPSLQLRN